MNRFLDCGCCIKDDGSRVWCPTCANGGSSYSPSAGSACPCGGEGYAGVAHDLETARKEREEALTIASELATALFNQMTQHGFLWPVEDLHRRHSERIKAMRQNKKDQAQ